MGGEGVGGEGVGGEGERGWGERGWAPPLDLPLGVKKETLESRLRQTQT